MVKLLSSSFEILPVPTIDTILRHLERIGRTCYKSENKIMNDSDIILIQKWLNSKHWAMLEHYSFRFEATENLYRKTQLIDNGEYLHLLPIVKTSFIHPQTNQPRFIISMSIRGIYDLAGSYHVYDYAHYLRSTYPQFAFMFPDTLFTKQVNNADADLVLNVLPESMENNILRILWDEDLTQEEIPFHAYRTIKFVCDRGVSHEAVRSRGSFAQESQRWINYNQDKFDKQISVIPPFKIGQTVLKCSPDCPKESCDCGKKDSAEAFTIWFHAMQYLEKAYMRLIELGQPPEIARSVLPNSTKTEINITFNINHWRHFFRIRCHKTAHPDMRKITLPLLIKMRDLYPNVFDDLVDLYHKEIDEYAQMNLSNLIDDLHDWVNTSTPKADTIECDLAKEHTK